MNKWVCKNDKCEKPCYAEPPNTCRPINCLLKDYITPNWQKADEPITSSSQLPKLTAEVFDRPNCPEWAQWAAVDENGKAYYFANKPKYYSAGYFRDLGWDAGHFMLIGDFDSSDWKNSLIEHQEKKETLPDWCKPEAVGYEKNTGVYFKVDEIDHDSIALQCPYGNDNKSTLTIGYFNKSCPVQARIRKYNAKEMRGLVGKIIENDNYTHFINAFDKKLMEVVSGSDSYTASELLEFGYTINGEPCGKFEHLKNGKWVE